MEKVEFKIQQDPWTPWEEIPVRMTTVIETPKEANDFAWAMSTVLEQEVRWNYVGSHQGHYINAKYELRG